VKAYVFSAPKKDLSLNSQAGREDEKSPRTKLWWLKPQEYLLNTIFQ
jgi:hypothetical protein